MRENEHCTFCNLIHGAAEVSLCHEDSDAIAFMDIQPVNNGHVLVVPREHYESLLDVPEEIGLHLFRVTMRLANAVRRVSGCDDMNIVVNSGKAAGQDEPHYHVHIIPRQEGDGFDIPLPFDGSSMPDRTVLDAYAARIIAALRDPMRIDDEEKPEDRRATAPTAQSEPAARRTDRPVALATYRESDQKKPARSRRSGDSVSPKAGSFASPSTLSAGEGAHGELLTEPSSNADDRG